MTVCHLGLTRVLGASLWALVLSATYAVADDSLSTAERASSAGARLDTDLKKGGGTDDTEVLQRLLDRGAQAPLHVILDGPALVTGLDVFGNTTIECTADGGLYLKDGSNRAILRNAHRSRTSIEDEHIEIRGCFFNGNRQHQQSASFTRPDVEVSGPSNKEPDGTYLSGLQFLGVNHLKIEDVTLWNVRAFGVLIGNASEVDIRRVAVDHGGGADAALADYLMTDGLHFKGPLRRVFIDSVRLRVGDDSIAFNANDYETNDITTRNDFGPYVGQGPITDVWVNDVQLDSANGIRILSTNERIDRIVVRNVSGTVKSGYFLTVGHWMNRESFGNVGRITFSDIRVSRPAGPMFAPSVKERMRASKPLYGEWNGGDIPFINVNGRIEALQIHGVTTSVADARPLLRIGPDAALGGLDAELNAVDTLGNGKLLQVDEGASISQMNLALRRLSNP